MNRAHLRARGALSAIVAIVLALGLAATPLVPAYADTATEAGAASSAKREVSVTVEVLGIDAAGSPQVWVPRETLEEAEGSTAADLTEQVLDAAGLTHEAFGAGTKDYFLSTITSRDGRKLGWDQKTGCYWQLFVNGEASQVGAGQVELGQGDVVVWCYSSYGSPLPAPDTVVDPFARRPDVGSDWPAFAGGDRGASTDADTPTTEAKEAWAAKLPAHAGDPIIVGGDVYVVSGNELLVIDPATGETKASKALMARMGYFSRPAYADGVVVIPLADGRLQAVTADTLTTVWVTDGLPADAEGSDQQPLGTVTVADGNAYFTTTVPSGTSSSSGYFGSVSLESGARRWLYHNDRAGYYWDGAAKVGSLLVIADDSGALTAFDAATGAIRSSLPLSAPARSTVVTYGRGCVLVVTTDGVLHKVAVSADGSLTELGRASFATASTSTPTVADGLAFVGGATADFKGVLAVVDLEGMRVSHSVTAAGGKALPGEVKSAPLVSTQKSGTFAYFTCNALPGGVYVYRLGADEAAALFVPRGAQEDYSTASVVASSAGSLFYANDSGYLVKLVAGEEPGRPATDEPASGSDLPGPGDGGGSEPAGDGASAAAVKPVAPSTGEGQGSKDSKDEGSRSAGGEAAADSRAAEATSTPLESRSAAKGVGEQTSGPASSAPDLPLWPIVGICVGAAALVLLLVWIVRNRRDERDGGRR